MSFVSSLRVLRGKNLLLMTRPLSSDKQVNRKNMSTGYTAFLLFLRQIIY